MKVTETYASYSNTVDIGRFSFFIILGEEGVEMDKNNIVEQIVNFPRVVFLGDTQYAKDDIITIMKKARKSNPDITFELNSNGKNKITGFSSFNNIVFNVSVNINDYEEKDEKILLWFDKYKANFVFNVTNKNDVDKVDDFIKDVGISKSLVYISIKVDEDKDNIVSSLFKSKIYGFNFIPNINYKDVKNDMMGTVNE